MALPPELERMRGDGESTQQVLDVGPATLAVTDRRVLALTPDSEGANFRAIERPNVEGVATEGGGNRAHLRRAIKPGILGVVLLGASQVVGVEGLATSTTVPEGTGQLGLGGLFAIFELLFGFLAVLDTLLLAGGLGLSCLALLSIALYGYSRTPRLQVDVAGEADLRVPLEPDDRSEDPDPATVLNHALGTSSKPASATSPTSQDPRSDAPSNAQ